MFILPAIMRDHNEDYYHRADKVLYEYHGIIPERMLSIPQIIKRLWNEEDILKTGTKDKAKDMGSVVILGGLSLVNSLHAYTFASLKRKKLISTTPLNDALNALILALNASAAAFVLLFTKKFRILS